MGAREERILSQLMDKQDREKEEMASKLPRAGERTNKIIQATKVNRGMRRWDPAGRN